MKTLFLYLILISCHALQAQTGKGCWMIGGAAAYSSLKGEVTIYNSGNPTFNYTRNINRSFSPLVGYFVSKGLVMGINFDFQMEKRIYSFTPAYPAKEQSHTKRTTFVNLFIQKYLMLNTAFGVYTGIKGGTGPLSNITESIETDTSYQNKESGHSTEIGLMAGIVYFPDRRFGLQAGIGGLGWRRNTWEATAHKMSNNLFKASLNELTLNFGLCYFLNK